MRWTALRGIAAIIVSVAAVAAANQAGAEQTPYTVAATQACIQNLPAALVGLPPARPPTPALFVYRVVPERLVPPAVATLWAFKGANSRWEELNLAFLTTERRARGYAKSVLGRHLIVRNVVVSTDTPAASWQKAVLACLHSGVPPQAAPTRTPPKASLATFVGYWGGHTRGLRISATGRGSESASDGCCMPAYDLTFQIVRVAGTVSRATATYRVIRFKRYPTFNKPTLRPGQMGELRLRNGIVTNQESDDYFCSGPAWEATGACGA
jgi:hypothetical protein